MGICIFTGSPGGFETHKVKKKTLLLATRLGKESSKNNEGKRKRPEKQYGNMQPLKAIHFQKRMWIQVESA